MQLHIVLRAVQEKCHSIETQNNNKITIFFKYDTVFGMIFNHVVVKHKGGLPSAVFLKCPSM